MEILRNLLSFLELFLAGVAISIMAIIVGYALIKLLFRNPKPRQSGFSKKSF